MSEPEDENISLTENNIEKRKDVNEPVKLSKSVKFAEFMYGFLLSGAINSVVTLLIRLPAGDDVYGTAWVTAIMFASIPLFIINIFGVFYFSKRRKYFMFGIFPMLFCSMVAMFACGSCLLGLY